MQTQAVTPSHAGSPLLVRTLRANAIFSETSGLVSLLAAGFLSRLTGIEPPLVFTIVGVALLLYGAGLYLMTRSGVDRRVAQTAIALDVLWVIGSAVLLVGGWLPLTVAGKWLIAILADVVLLFAILQTIGLRRAG